MVQKFIILSILLISGSMAALTGADQTGCKSGKFVAEVGAGCQECEQGYTRYFFEGTDKYYRCVKCGDNCQTCATKPKTNSKEHEAGDCSTCTAGFGVDKATGTKCKNCATTDCQSCNQDYKVCTQCSASKSLSTGGTCVDCSTPNCQLCNKEGKCVFCEDPKVLSGVSCTSTCLPGTVSDNGRCQTCPMNCATCNEVGKCQSCMSGFYVDSSQQCTSCGANCGKCGRNAKCNECLNDTVVLSDGTCGSQPWYKKWWVWLLIALPILALLGALAYFLSRRTTMMPANNADTQMQYVNTNYSYAPRAGNSLHIGQPILGTSTVSRRGYY